MMRRVGEFPHGEVWWCDLREPPPAAQLSPEEHERAARFFFDRDRVRYLASHAALRQLLVNRDASPGASFATGAHGKPRLPGIGWHFNLSHSDNEALIALSATHEVGVDVEAVKAIDHLGDLAHQYFTPRELGAWLSLDEVERRHAFFALWSRKEACVKAAGWGLNLPLQRFDVGFTDFRPRDVELPLPTGGFARMTLMSLPLDTGSAGAVAWLDQGAGSQ